MPFWSASNLAPEQIRAQVSAWFHQLSFEAPTHTSHESWIDFFNRRSAAPRLRELSVSNGAGPMLSCSPTTEGCFSSCTEDQAARSYPPAMACGSSLTRDYSRRLQSNQLTLNLPVIMCSCFQTLLAYFMNDARMNSIGLLGAANEKNMKFSGLVKRGLPLIVF